MKKAAFRDNLRSAVRSLASSWYVWLSIVVVYLFESPPSLQFFAKNPVILFFGVHQLLAVLLSFLVLMLLVPNFILYQAFSRWSPKWITPIKYPKRYFDTIQTANNVLLAIVGIVLGLFKLSPGQVSFAEYRTVVLLFASGFSGLIAIISQITPQLRETKSGRLWALPLTKHIVFVATYFQVIFLVVGLSEAYLSFNG